MSSPGGLGPIMSPRGRKAGQKKRRRNNAKAKKGLDFGSGGNADEHDNMGEQQQADASPAKRMREVALTPGTKSDIKAEYCVWVATGRKKGGIKKIMDKYDLVSRNMPRKIAKGIVPIVDHRAAGGNLGNLKLTDEDWKFIEQTLKENKFDLTYQELEHLCKKAVPPLDISASTIWRGGRRRKWKLSSRRTRPYLTKDHLIKRKAWAIAVKGTDWKFVIDIDEKWFYTWSNRRKSKVPPGETAPKTPVWSKRYIPKIMFLTAITEPDPTHNFNGLIGIWPVGKMQKAKRNSKNRAAGTWEWKSENMTGDMFKRYISTKVIPAIKRKMPWAKDVWLQYDNARTHVKGGDDMIEAIDEAGAKGNGPRVQTLPPDQQQPAQSPDTNLNDLGFYSSIDSKLPRPRPRNLTTFKQAVMKAFKDYPTETLTKIVRSKERVIHLIEKYNGMNDYDLHEKE